MAADHDRPFGPTPWEAPLTYPGPWPTSPVRLVGDRLEPMDAEGVAAALAEERQRVLAVGSNGSPAQLHRKLTGAGVALDVPLLPVTVDGLLAAHTAWVAPYGSIPTSATAAPGTTSELVLGLLTDEQAAAVDATEGPYDRPVLDPTAHAVVEAATGQRLVGVSCYVAGGELLADPATGAPIAVQDQSELWSWLLDAVPGVAALCGSTPAAAFAALAADRQRRAALAVLLIRAGATTPVRAVASVRG